MNNKNTEVLADFINYCNQHPEMRFWQALRNWSGYPFVYVSHDLKDSFDVDGVIDTFYWEGKDK